MTSNNLDPTPWRLAAGGATPGASWALGWVVLLVLVKGPSMVPTLRHGDALLVRRGGRGVRAGDVVVARFRTRPDLLVVKRAVRPHGDGWWVRSDNALTTGDSRAYGAADVVGRVVCRWWPRPALLGRSRPSAVNDL